MSACVKLLCIYSGEFLLTFLVVLVFMHGLEDQMYLDSRHLTLDGFLRNFPGIFGNQQQHYMEVIKRMLVQCMQDQANPQVSFDFRILDGAGPILVTITLLYISFS